MGQQQLILLVLATVIVGIAIVVGIRAFTENSIKANSDAMMQDLVRMASDAQAWKQKPAPFGGQDAALQTNLVNFTGATLSLLGYADPYTNLNGTFTLVSADDEGLVLQATNAQKGNCARLLVDGITDATIHNTHLQVGTWDGATACAALPD